MERFAPDSMAVAILAAPAWARVGITAPSESVRERAAGELARWLVDQLEPQDEPDRNQLILPL